jgi:hypothetical protein
MCTAFRRANDGVTARTFCQLYSNSAMYCKSMRCTAPLSHGLRLVLWFVCWTQPGVSLPPFPERNLTLPKSGISGCVKDRVRGQRENIGMPATCQRENVTKRPYLFHANCSATVHTYVTRLSSQFWGRLGPGFRSRSASVCNNAGRGVGSGDCVMQDAIYRDNLE